MQLRFSVGQVRNSKKTAQIAPPERTPHVVVADVKTSGSLASCVEDKTRAG